VIHHYRLLLEYKGTSYLGWQIQPEGKTIQGEVNRALKIISKSENVRTLGSGRTDSGVHALGQVVKVSIELEINSLNLLRALNSHLPSDIRVKEVTLSDEEFMPTVHAKSKEYHYRFMTGRNPNAFQGDFIAPCPHEINPDLVHKACEMLTGEHDFVNYFCEGTDVNSTVRTIFRCGLKGAEKLDGALFPEHYVFFIEGSGFLKQMVRLIVGALWNVGRGKISLEEFQASLGPPKRERLGVVAPPEGLYLVRVNY
jgi:tRNA pseudouridine38-40 synthase